MDENDPQLKLKLLEAARNSVPDYPDVKKGIGCGAAALVAAVILTVIPVSFCQTLSAGSKVSLIAGCALIAAIICGGVAAFRPPRQ